MGWGHRRGRLVTSVDTINSGVPGPRIITLGRQDIVQYVILEMRCEIMTLIDRIIETFFDKIQPINVWAQLRSLTLKTGFKIKDIEDVIEALKLFDPNTVTNVAVDLYAGGYWEFWSSYRACKPLQGHDSFREQLEQALLRFPHPNVAVSFERPLHYSGGYMWYHHYFRAYFPILRQRDSFSMMPKPGQLVFAFIVCRSPTDAF